MIFKNREQLGGQRLRNRVKGTSNNYQFVTPAPYPVVGSNRQVRGKLRREARDVKRFWIPAFAGMTFLEVA
jgi:hypothetical protein